MNYFFPLFLTREHTLCSPLKRADYPLSVIKALFVLFCFIYSYSFCYLHNWPVNTAWLSTLLYFLPTQGVSRPWKILKKKIKQKYYNDEIEEIFTTIYVVKYTVPFEFA